MKMLVLHKFFGGSAFPISKDVSQVFYYGLQWQKLIADELHMQFISKLRNHHFDKKAHPL